MNGLRHTATRRTTNGLVASVVRPSNGRAATYRRFLQQRQSSDLRLLETRPTISSVSLHPVPLKSRFLPQDIRTSSASLSLREFHSGARLAQDKQSKAAEEPDQKEPTEGKAAKEASGKNSDSTSSEEKPNDEGESSEGKAEKDQKEAPPPPPPHGDKSPWQVFTDTLQTEFKASKEWNESTKALAAGAQQFTENESVRRARQAYESTTGAVTSTTATVLKSTAGVVGKGAAWTWETPVVKGVRSTVNATANVIEKGTRPIRETEAYKNVKNVIDDGSSSRYGGWVEKEERRKARELREMREAQASGRPGNRVEILQEDPE